MSYNDRFSLNNQCALVFHADMEACFAIALSLVKQGNSLLLVYENNKAFQTLQMTFDTFDMDAEEQLCLDSLSTSQARCCDQRV